MTSWILAVRSGIDNAVCPQHRGSRSVNCSQTMGYREYHVFTLLAIPSSGSQLCINAVPRRCALCLLHVCSLGSASPCLATWEGHQPHRRSVGSGGPSASSAVQICHTGEARPGHDAPECTVDITNSAGAIAGCQLQHRIRSPSCASQALLSSLTCRSSCCACLCSQ